MWIYPNWNVNVNLQILHITQISVYFAYNTEICIIMATQKKNVLQYLTAICVKTECYIELCVAEIGVITDYYT